MWERRYGFPTPARRPSGARLYTDEDVRVLGLITQAIRGGYRPGDVVGKPAVDLERLVAGAPVESVTSDAAREAVAEALDALARDDLPGLRARLRRAAILLGPSAFVTDLAHPATVAVGERWERGELDVRHEHMLTECLSLELRLIIAAFDQGDRRPLVLLATLPGEPHSLGIEMVAAFLATRGVAPVLLGPRTPRDQIVAAARAYRVDAIGIGVVLPPASLDDLTWILEHRQRDIPVLVGGRGAVGIRARGAEVLLTWGGIEKLAKRLTAAK